MVFYLPLIFIKKHLPTSTSILAPVAIKPGLKSNFGEKRSYETHPGADIPVPVGTPVLSPMDGVVKLADFNNNRLCGATIDIDYKNGFTSRFCHMSRIDVQTGDVVKQGQSVGLSGGKVGAPGAGNSQGPHLHFTLKKNGILVDPLEYINKTVSGSEIVSPENADSMGISDIVSKLQSKVDFNNIDFLDYIKSLPKDSLSKLFQNQLFGIFTEEVKRIIF